MAAIGPLGLLLRRRNEDVSSEDGDDDCIDCIEAADALDGMCCARAVGRLGRVVWFGSALSFSLLLPNRPRPGDHRPGSSPGIPNLGMLRMPSAVRGRRGSLASA